MIVTSRIEGYCRAVWELLLQCANEHDEGTCLHSPGAAASVAPLAMFLAAVRMLVQHLILLRVQALHISAVSNEADARALLQHVLLWQHLRQNTVMDLITLALEQGAGSPPATGRGTNAAHGSFLMSAGVPLVQQAIAQVRPSHSPHSLRILCCLRACAHAQSRAVCESLGETSALLCRCMGRSRCTPPGTARAAL